MGSTTRVSAQRPSRPAESPDPDDRGHGPRLHDAIRRSTTQGGHQLPCDAPGNHEMATRAMTDAALHTTTNEPPPCLQCRHGLHSSALSHLVMMWPQDRDESHAQTSTRRRRSLQAKLARTSLRLTTLRSGEPPLCIKTWPQTLYKGSQGTHLGTWTHSSSSTISFIHHSSRAPGVSLRAAPHLA
jgi:hypothetical protein